MSKAFGTCLRKLRNKSRKCVEDVKQTFTQMAFVKELENAVGVIYSHAALSNWERGKNSISHQDRALLFGIIKVLFKCGGLTSLEQANELLASGNYAPLTEDEIRGLDPSWISGKAPLPTGKQTLSNAERIAGWPVLGVAVGIDELVTTVANRLANKESGIHIALQGRRGIGKTKLANACLRRFLQTTSFSELHWLSVAKFPALVLQLVEKLRLAGLNEQPTTIQLHQVRIALQQTTCLLVIDGVEDETQLTAVIDLITQLPTTTRVLFTTRVAPPTLSPASIDVVLMPDLARDVALSLLRQLNPALELDDLNGLYEGVGGHPEALNLVARYSKTFSIGRILRILRSMQLAEVQQFFDNIYAELWGMLSAETKTLLRLLYFISNEGAGEETLRIAGGLPEYDCLSAIQQANQVGLLHTHGTPKSYWYSLHNLTRYYINAQEASLHIEALAVVRYWQRRVDVLDSADTHLFDRNRANIFQAFRLALSHADDAPELQQALYQFSLTLYQFVTRRGFAPEWIPLHERFVSADWLTDEQRCLCYNQLGYLHRLQKQLTLALDTHHRSENLAIPLQDTTLLAQVHYNLALDYRDIFDYTRSKLFAEKARDVFATTRPSNAIATNNLLGTIALLTGAFNEAETHFRTGIARLNDDTATMHARLLLNLARVQRSQNLYDDANETLAQAKALLPSNVTTLHHSLWLTQSTLFLAQENPERAIAALEKLNKSKLEQLGEFQTIGLMRHNMANAYLLQNEYGKADYWLHKAIKVWELLDDQKHLALSLDSLGDTFDFWDKQKVAREKWEAALAVVEGLGASADYRLQQLRADLMDKLL